MWGGKLRFTVPMKFAVGFISTFTLGGFGGLVLAMVPTDITLHDTYFVVGHFHLVLVGGSTMLLMAMAYYWWPKMTGRILDERVGNIVFWCMLIGVFVCFIPMHIVGALGMARRIPVYYADFAMWNKLVTIGYIFTFVSAVVFFFQLLLSYRKQLTTENDPWKINDLQQSFEWATTSPPPVYNFETVPPIPVIDQAPTHH